VGVDELPGEHSCLYPFTEDPSLISSAAILLSKAREFTLQTFV
jgi:hypothetical protein